MDKKEEKYSAGTMDESEFVVLGKVYGKYTHST